jgi:predicted ATPase
MSVQIHLKNVAQISRATFDLSDLTVFIGPNNSGKSVAAICAYAACQPTRLSTFFSPPFQAHAPRSSKFEVLEFPRPAKLDEWEREADALIGLLGQIGEGVDPKAVRVPKILREYTERQTREILHLYGTRLVQELERCFGTRLDAIARKQNRAKSEMVVESTMWPWRVAINLREPDGGVVVKKIAPARHLVQNVLRAFKASKLDLDELDMDARAKSSIFSDFVWYLAAYLFRSDFPKNAQYLPAERSGILQGHRLLAGAVLRRAPWVGIERLDMPQMSGVITDFLTNVLEIDETSETSGEFSEAADELESKILKGTVAIERQDQGYPEIAFRQGSATFPLHRVSSMVTEIAPVVLYLRDLLNEGDLFIIEEPESHLHPKNQVRIAEVLTQLRADGLRLLVTTHSDYLLAEMSNAIRASSLAEADEEGGPSPGLDPATISAYGFRETVNGTTVTPLAVSPIDGIDEAEFGQVTEKLYVDTLELEEKLRDHA